MSKNRMCIIRNLVCYSIQHHILTQSIILEKDTLQREENESTFSDY